MTLFSKTILLTRPQEQSEESRKIFEDFGATVFIQPTIKILPPENWKSVDQVIQTLASFDWIIFSSSNGVHHFFQRIQTVLNRQSPPFPLEQRDQGEKSDSILFSLKDQTTEKTEMTKRKSLFIQYWEKHSIKIAALGPGTAITIKNYGLTVDLIPLEYSAEGMIAAIKKEINNKNKNQRFLSIRANRGRDVLKKGLTELGSTVQEVVAYRSVDIDAPNPQIVQLLNDRMIDAIIITSSAIAKSLIQMFGESLKKTALVSISPLTSKVIQEKGFNITFEAENASLDHIADLLEKKL